MDLKSLLQNKMMLAIVVGGIVLILAISIICAIAGSKGSKSEAVEVSNEPLKEDVDTVLY